jgi:NTP pyrophosphatase (non-canonical NTP hydrolase)
VTGAREADALGIVIEEIETAIKLHSEYTLPVRSPESMSPEEQEQAGASMVPYPVNIALEVATALHAVEEVQEEAAA